MLASDNAVSLLVGGKNYYGWQEMSFQAGLNVIARGCEVSVGTSVTSTDFCEDLEIGEECQIKIGGKTILTGYIVKQARSYKPTEIKITVTVKSKTVDLEECSIPLGMKPRWADSTLGGVLADIASYYGINVVDNSGLKEKTTFDAPTHGTILSFLQSQLKAKSVVFTDNENGDLVITKVGEHPANDRLEMGKNVISGDRVLDGSKLFKTYAVTGQGADPKSQNGTPANNLYASALNNKFSRKRVTVVNQSGSTNGGELSRRASLLMNNSIGNADKLTYTVQGLYQSNGNLWEPNLRVIINDKFLNVFSEVIINKVSFKIDDKNGSVTTLELKHSLAYTPTDLETKASAKGKAKKKISTQKKGTTFIAGAGTGKLP